MKSRNVWVGILVAVAVVLFATGLFLIGNEHKAFRRHTEFFTDFTNVDGISKGAKVRVNGMDGGEVAEVVIPLSPKEKFRLKMTIDDRLRGLIRGNSVVSVETEGLVGDKFLLIGGGSESSPEAGSGTTLSGKEPLAVSKMMEQANGLLTQVSGTVTQAGGAITQVRATITDLQGRLDGTLNAATSTLNNSNGMVSDLRHGKGAAGVLLADPVTAANVKQAVLNARDATGSLNAASAQVNGMVSEMQQRQLVAKIDDTLKNTRSASLQIDQASQQMNAMLKSAFAPDQFGEGAGTNLQQTLTNINEATGNLADDTEALKSEFFFRGFFRKRGYNSLDRLPVESYRDGTLLKKQAQSREWISAAQLFEAKVSPDKSDAEKAGSTETLSAAGRAAIDEAVSKIPNLYTSPLIVEGYSDAGTAGQMLLRSRQRAILVRDYLQLHFDLASQNIGVIGMSAVTPVETHRQTWDGICLTHLTAAK